MKYSGFTFALIAVLAIFSSPAQTCEVGRVNGVIIAIDYDRLVFELETHCGWVVVQATERTRIMKGDEPIEFGELEVEMKVAALGYYEEEVFVAKLIVARGESHYDFYRGIIGAIFYDEMAFVLVSREGEEILVQATDDTKIVGGHERLEFWDLEERMKVAVAGSFGDEETLKARLILVRLED